MMNYLTMLTEVEAIIISRPLSYVSSKDLDESADPHLTCCVDVAY